MQARITALGNPGTWGSEEQQAYQTALASGDPEQFLKVVMPALLTAQAVKSVDEIRPLVTNATLAYPLLLRADRQTDAATVHTQLQASLKQQGYPGTLADEEYRAYLGSVAQAAPQQAQTDIQALLTATLPPDEGVRICQAAIGTYAPLIKGGQLPVAKAIHDQVQAWLQQAKQPAMQQVDTRAFRDSLSDSALDAMLVLFKQAAAAKDLATAKTWLTQLNLIAL
jgi:hypothetical protein